LPPSSAITETSLDNGSAIADIHPVSAKERTNMSQAAAVIDLDTVRRERQRRAEPPAAMRRPTLPAVCLLPVFVTWIPVWPVA
jgi:hypothetical protein